jgi:hypothetical protein
MKNWKQVATGLDAGLSEVEIEGITPALDALEAAFGPLAAAIPYEAEPAVTFEALFEDRP